ncbi:UNVERIFIED_CONTAM: hypothetical protein FKN15_025500 [Acipenser sinensis]
MPRVFKKSSPNCKYAEGLVIIHYLHWTVILRHCRSPCVLLCTGVYWCALVCTGPSAVLMEPLCVGDVLLDLVPSRSRVFRKSQERLGIPQNLPCSVTLQPGPEDTGKACGVDFEIRAFCAKAVDEKIHKSFSPDDDIVFEDFARLRLKGMKDDDDDHFC